MSPGLPQGVLAGGCHEQGLSSAYGKEKLAGKELIREYGVYVKACNELLLPVVSRYPLSERFQQVDRELRRQMKAATDREALITALMEQMEDVERSLPPPEKEGAVSPEKKCGEKEE